MLGLKGLRYREVVLVALAFLERSADAGDVVEKSSFLKIGNSSLVKVLEILFEILKSLQDLNPMDEDLFL